MHTNQKVVKSMNKVAVAEQVETKEEFETLIDLQMQYLQGYYLGRPKLEKKA